MTDWWKFTATGLAGALIACVGFWLSVLPGYATEGQVRQMIVSEAPGTVAPSIDRMTSAIHEMGLQQARFGEQLRALVERLDRERKP